MKKKRKKTKPGQQELMRRSKLDPHAGNVMTPDKPEGSFRLWWGNLGFLSAWRSDGDSQHFINQLAHNQVDMACVCEPNLQWHKVDTHNNWYERSTQVLGPQTFQFAYNQHDRNNTSTKQMGGMGIIARLEARPRVQAKGQDPHKLGRWTWMLMEGRHGTMVRVMEAYRPVKSMVTQGTVYNQQLRHWRDDQRHLQVPHRAVRQTPGGRVEDLASGRRKCGSGNGCK